MTDTSIHLVSRISSIDQEAWDKCSGGKDPFTSYAFISSLEDSGCVSPETGWQPSHLQLKHGEDTVGVTPAYIKTHSYGEYVFDHGWASAFERAGGRYYPKVQASIPFSPVNGPRLLAAKPQDKSLLAAGLRGAARNTNSSSAHMTFQTKADAELMEQAGFLTRLGIQFQFENRGYENFSDFLNSMSARKRKNIKKERSAVDKDLTLRALTGNDLNTAHFDAFYSFYKDTSDRKWGQAYLNREFFDLLHQRLADKIVLMMAFCGSQPVAGALNLRSDSTLFGRNWGCVEHHKFLHFELCYYMAIDYALEHGLQRVEAGAQGSHKISRGYEPIVTYSSHYIEHLGFREAVKAFLAEERAQTKSEVAHINERMSPFRKKNY